MNSPLNMRQFVSDCFRAYYLHLLYLSTNQLIHSLLIRTKWTTGNGTLMSSSHWPIFKKSLPLIKYSWAWPILAKFQNKIEMKDTKSNIPIWYWYGARYWKVYEKSLNLSYLQSWFNPLFPFKTFQRKYFCIWLWRSGLWRFGDESFKLGINENLIQC